MTNVDETQTKCSYCDYFSVLVGTKEDIPYCTYHQKSLKENGTCENFKEPTNEDRKSWKKHYREGLGWYD